MTKTAIVNVQSGWYSKINWIQVGGAILSTATALVGGHAFGLDDAETVKVLGVLNMVQGIATIIIRVYFTNTITPSSL